VHSVNSHLSACPDQFIGNTTRQTVAAKVHWQNIPCVCFDLVVSDAIFGLDRSKELTNFTARCAEWPEKFCVDWNMKVNPPYAIWRFIKGTFKVIKEMHFACSIEDTRLMQKLWFVEGAKCSEGAL
jgi:hypothetical protein